jgi:polar amino acid transport system substrate-binding protein
VSYQYLPQARNLHLLKLGQLDVGLPLVHTPNRDDYAVFTYPLAMMYYSLYTTKNIDLTGDLSNYHFSIMRSSARGGSEFLSNNPGFIEVGKWGNAVELARIGRSDGVVIPEPVVKYLPSSVFEGFKQYDFGSIPASMYVSKKNVNTDFIVQRFNLAIQDCLSKKK